MKGITFAERKWKVKCERAAGKLFTRLANICECFLEAWSDSLITQHSLVCLTDERARAMKRLSNSIAGYWRAGWRKRKWWGRGLSMIQSQASLQLPSRWFFSYIFDVMNRNWINWMPYPARAKFEMSSEKISVTRSSSFQFMSWDIVFSKIVVLKSSICTKWPIQYSFGSVITSCPHKWVE